MALFVLGHFSGVNDTILLLPVTRAEEFLWPVQVEQCFPALLFCAV